MTKIVMRIILGLWILTFLACSHGQTANQSSMEEIQAGVTGVILPITLSAPATVVPQEGCRLDIRRGEDTKEFPVLVKPGKQNAFLEVPAGTYSFFDLFCGRNKTWDFSSKKWAPIIVVAEKISLAAPVDFRINQAGGMTTFFSNRDT